MIQIICTLVLFLLILFPVGNYIYHISAGKKTWADPLFDRVDNVIFKSLRIDELEAIRAAFVAGQRLSCRCRVSDPAAAVGSVFESESDWKYGGKSFLQYDYFVYDQYQSAALFRRIRFDLFFSDGSHHHDDVHLGRQRICCLRCDGERAAGPADGKLL